MAKTFQITDGTNTIDLLNLHGFYARSWPIAATKYKNDGTFSDSPLSEGRQLVHKVFNTVAEVVELYVFGTTQDAVISNIRNLQAMIEAANNYWTGFSTTPVYIVAQANDETNARYCLIHYAQLDGFDDLYSPAFEVGMETAQRLGKGMPSLQFGFERGHWLSIPPAVAGNCVQLSATYAWNYNRTWQTVDVDTSSAAVKTFGMFKASNGYLYTTSVDGSNYGIFRSTDNGETWTQRASISLPTGNFIETLGNAILCIVFGNGNVYRSTDGGGSFSLVGDVGTSGGLTGVVLDNGDVLVPTASQIFTSSDDGENWSSANFDNTYLSFPGIVKLANGRLILVSSWNPLQGGASRPFAIFTSDDAGITWNTVYANSNQHEGTNIIQLSDGTIITLRWNNSSNDVYVMRSTDNGATWGESILFTTTNPAFAYLATDGSSVYILADNNATPANVLFTSIDSGITWQQENTGSPFAEGTSDIGVMAVADNGNLVISGTGTADNQVLLRKSGITTTQGQTETCNNQVFVSNQMPLANITDLFYEDNSGGPSYTTVDFPMSLPALLFPASAGQNDALYIVINSSNPNRGPFSSVVFDLERPFILSSGSSLDVVWEYYNGSWVTLAVQDNTIGFTITGVKSVHWRNPSDWTAVTLNSITGFMVRARINSASVGSQSPRQQNRNIYVPTLPRVGISSTEISGDIPALIQINAFNRSDLDGSNDPVLYANRLICGIRSYSRGSNFRAYINLSDSQAPTGIAVSAGTNTTFGDSMISPTGRAMTYNPVGVETMATRATISFDPGITKDFYGVYHAFLRAQRSAGNASDIEVRLQVVSGSGGVIRNYKNQTLQSTTAFEVLDMGRIELPVGLLKNTELGDQAEIRIQASAASGTPNLVLFDLVLIPTDEWSIDAKDKANDSNSMIGSSNNLQKYLDIDSILYPKSTTRAMVRGETTQHISSVYQPVSIGSSILSPNAEQYMWFLAMQTSATGSSYSWISPPEICHSILIYKNERFLTLRGN